MHEYISSSQIAVHGIAALFGAFVHAAKAHRLGQSKTFLDFLTLVLMSSFSGAMFALLGFHFFPGEHYISMALAGTGGFLGVEGMTIAISKIQDMLTKK